MEDVYTIKVKCKPDTRNLFPSERRYSASTVSGLAWVHIALAATSFLLACLALVSPNAETIDKVTLNETNQSIVNRTELLYNLTLETTTVSEENVTDSSGETSNYTGDVRNGCILIIAPSLVTVFALGAGIAAVMASVRWYIDKNINWLFYISVLSAVVSFVAIVMIVSWFVNTSQDGESISEFYRDKIPFKDYFVVKHTDVKDRNASHLIIMLNNNEESKKETTQHSFTKRVLSINILIASFLEFLWSILSVRIAYKGMRNNYKEHTEIRGNCVSVVTKIKGNNAKKCSRNGKLMPQKPDLIENYPNKKINDVFLASGEDGYYLKKQNNDKNTKYTETSSEFYKERMMNFLNRCASLDASNSETSPSVQSETALNTIPESTNVELNVQSVEHDTIRYPVTPSWGDSPHHTIYNQNNINFDTIFKFGGKENENGCRERENDGSEKENGGREQENCDVKANPVEQSEEMSENALNS